MINKLFFLLNVTLVAFSLSAQSYSNMLLKELYNPKSNYVFVVAHRGDWRNAPENSLQAVERCIDMGVDVVEVDIRMTKDSVLVLMHDLTVDRTTDGAWGWLVDHGADIIQTDRPQELILYLTEVGRRGLPGKKE